MDGEVLDQPDLEGVVAVVTCDATGDILHAEGNDAEILGGIASFISEMAALIGGSFGLDTLEEGQLLGRNTTAVCLQRGETVVGILFEGRNRSKSAVPRILDHLGLT